jgi:transcriptional regulator GlxA family with amidase domain
MSREKKLIVVVPMPGTFLLDIAGPCDVFAAADSALDGNGGYEVLLASPLDTNKIVTKGGLEIVCPTTVTAINTPIDTLIIAGFSIAKLPEGNRFIQWLKYVYPQLNRIGSVCVGTYALAEAGILDGKQATTHWAWWKKIMDGRWRRRFHGGWCYI